MSRTLQFNSGQAEGANAASAPAAIENLPVSNGCQSRRAHKRKSTQVQPYGTFAARQPEMPPGEQDTEDHPGQQRQAELVCQMLLDEIVDEDSPGNDCQREPGKTRSSHAEQQFFSGLQRREKLLGWCESFAARKRRS